MNTAVTARLTRWVAAFIAAALIVGGSIIVTSPASAAPTGVGASSLAWGFKQSWRNYIGFGGGVATASDGASKADGTPTSSYLWSAGAATFDPASGSGSAQFSGAVRFENTAHGIDLSVANPRVTFPGDGTGTIHWTDATGEVLGATLAGVTATAPVVNGTQSSVTVASTSASFTTAGGTPFTYAAGAPVDNVSFTLSYPTPVVAAATTTTLTAPASAVVGAPVALSAIVAPATAAGSVEFFDGATSLGSAPVASATASTSVTFAAAGAHSVTARFVPSDSTLFAASTSAATVVTASSAPVVTTPTVVVSKSTVVDGGELVTVTGSGFSPVGTATNGTRSPLKDKFGGVYVTFGRFAEVWKPSAGAASSARPADRSTLKWFVNSEDVATIGGAAAGGAAINPDGTFSVEMLVGPGYTGEPATGNYGIYTYPGGGVSYAAFETYTPITFSAAPVVIATTTSLTADPVAVTAGGSTTLTAQVTPANAVGSVAFSLGSTPLGSVAVSGGVASMPVGGLAAGVQQFTATFVPGNVLDFSGSTGSASVTVAEKSVGAGSLTWGIKQSFREYVAGPIAKGTITTSGVGASGGIFTFGQTAGGSYDRTTGVGTSAYSGSVRFSGHAGLLDVSIGNPVVRVDSATQGTLLASVNGGAAIPFATLNLAAASRSTPNNTVAYSGVPAALTSQGASVFALNGSAFYEAGTPLDPVSFVIGAPNVIASVGATVASFKAPNAAAPTPPATTGIEVAQGTTLTAGGEVTISASGFQPNETGILVVIYSTPTVLDTNATADAAGVVTWTGRLPAGLSGLHTLTLQGSVDRGVELNIAEAATTTAAVGCVVDDATLTWGFKESFRAYISGAIANGEWTVADGATYAVPDFGWSAGAGGYDSETGEGSLAFAGSVAFTGHAGVLNTIVSNPQVRFVDATTGVLLLDVSGTTQDGAAVDTKAVEFADLDLTGVVANDEGSVTVTAAPATLTAAGSAAFGTYPAGEALDPVTLAFSTAPDCGVVEPTPISATEDDEVVAVSTTNDLTWIIWAALALLVIAAVVTVIVVRRRKK